MSQEELILDKLSEIANKLDEQNLLQKTVLNFNEACSYLDDLTQQLFARGAAGVGPPCHSRAETPPKGPRRCQFIGVRFQLSQLAKRLGKSELDSNLSPHAWDLQETR